MSIPIRPDWARVPGAINPPTVPGVGHSRIVDGPHGPELAPPPKGTPIIFPWWLYEAPGSTDWELNSINFTAAANATTEVPNFSFNTGQGNKGVLTLLTITVLNPVATLDLRVTLLLNQAPIPGWSLIYIPPLAATAFVKDYNGMILRADENQTYTATVTNGELANAYTMTLQARGWTTPSKVIDQFSSGVNY